MNSRPILDIIRKSDLEEIRTLLDADEYLEDIEPFLLVIPQNLEKSTSFYQERYKQHIENSVLYLTAKIEELKRKSDYFIGSSEEISQKQTDSFTVSSTHEIEKLKFSVLLSRYSDLGQKIVTYQILATEMLIKSFSTLLKFAKWLQNHTYPIIINKSRANRSIDTIVFGMDRKTYFEYKAIKGAVVQQSNFLKSMPPLFKSSVENKLMVSKAIDQGMENRKLLMSYFEPLPIEQSLFLFFDSCSSPLYKDNLVPIKVGRDRFEVKDWIRRAALSVSTFEGTTSEERTEVIYVFLNRYLFERSFDNLGPVYSAEDATTDKMNKMSHTLTVDTQIPRKFITGPAENMDLIKYFQQSSVTSAPIEWLRLSIFKYAPIEIAFCIFKAHESLTIMAALTATNQKNGSNTGDFFKQMPGFDDIIELWVAALAVSGIPSPRSISEYLSEWTITPGFPARFKPCCVYLEASLSQLEEKA